MATRAHDNNGSRLAAYAWLGKVARFAAGVRTLSGACCEPCAASSIKPIFQLLLRTVPRLRNDGDGRYIELAGTARLSVPRFFMKPLRLPAGLADRRLRN